mmetsp:Transcript_4165/g.10785  ORF Transcript_4165/g.10785 Transcript_4165/m.10785 type:complete len:145 (-) Transcript_4165:1053-1487(-)
MCCLCCAVPLHGGRAVFYRTHTVYGDMMDFSTITRCVRRIIDPRARQHPSNPSHTRRTSSNSRDRQASLCHSAGTVNHPIEVHGSDRCVATKNQDQPLEGTSQAGQTEHTHARGHGKQLIVTSQASIYRLGYDGNPPTPRPLSE